VVTHSEPVSMSRETTFDRNLHAVADKAELGTVFTQLCQQVAADLQRKGYRGRTIGIKLRFEDFRTVTRDLTLDAPTDDAAAIRRAAGLCLKRVDLTRAAAPAGRARRQPDARARRCAGRPAAGPARSSATAVAPAEPSLFDGRAGSRWPERRGPAGCVYCVP
jgi:DNA polymerase-4